MPEELWDVGEGAGETGYLGFDLGEGWDVGEGGCVAADGRIDGLASSVAEGGGVLGVEAKEGGGKEGWDQDDSGAV